MTVYTLIRSDRRSVSLELKPDGSLLVRAPKQLARHEIERFIAEKSDWIARKQALLAHGNRAWGGEVLSGEVLAQLKAEAHVDLGARLAAWAARMGVQPARMTIRTQHARWGSCSERGTISLNALLMLAPEPVRDYVVVHELCHLKEMNHSPHFWAEVAQVLPDYKVQRKWLAENGHALLQRNPKS